MKHAPLTGNTNRAFVAVFDSGDDVLEQLQHFCEDERLFAARMYGIGGFRKVQLGYYDMEAKRYEPIDVDEQVEVVSFTGNVTSYQGKPRLHVHCVVSHRDGRCTAGHLLGGTVRPTLELFIDELPMGLRRIDRPDAGIPLIDLSDA